MAVGEGPFGRAFTIGLCRSGLATLRILCTIVAFTLIYDLTFVVAVQGGVRFVVPRTIRAQELDALELRMGEEDRRLVEAAFSSPNASGLRTFCGRPEQLRAWSGLAQAFAHALCEREGVQPSISSAMRILGVEYAAQGYDLADMKLKAAGSAMRSFVGCIVVIWATSRQLRRLQEDSRIRRGVACGL